MVSALLATALHTVMVLGCLWLLFNSLALEGGVTLAAVFGTVITLNGILEMVAAGVLSTAVLRGCDVDKPRNLAKSVTVE